jgi:hypothetical protein
MVSSENVELIANDLERLASKNKHSLPSAQQLYQIGGLLHRIPNASDGEELLQAYRDLIRAIPSDYLKHCFQLYQKGLTILLQSSNSSSSSSQEEDLYIACKNLKGLLIHAPPDTCELVYSQEWLSQLSSIYDKFVLKESHQSYKDTVLHLFHSLLLNGVFSSSTVESVMLAMQAMDSESTDCLKDLQNFQQKASLQTLQQSIDKLPWDEDTLHQREYLSNMLESALLLQPDDTNPSVVAKTTQKEPPPTKIKAISAADEVERRIEQVKQIIPDLGEGFIETALSLYQGNVEQTVSTLINDPSQYPPALQFLDISLPRRKKARAKDEAKESQEARALVKERMALEAAQQKEQYQALLYVSAQENKSNEYDDDYDDQYDEIDIKLGGADNGFEHDFEQIKLFNKVARDDEAEDSFWQANRNTNRVNSNAKDIPKQFRGPDKIKGGRVIGADGKVVRKPGGVKKKNINNRKQQQPKQKPQSSNVNNKNGPKSDNNNNKEGQAPQNNNKRTKPKSNNRVNRQRDRKQKAQGTFGV